MKAIIFGVDGQDGHYLSKACVQRGIEVIGVSRRGMQVKGDVADYQAVVDLIKRYQPTYIFHLAAVSTTRHDALFANHSAIATGTLNVLEAVKQYSPLSKVFITGSGVQFKNTGLPISETSEFEASSPYSIARIQSVYASRYYRSLGFKVYNGYLFHHESPLRPERHISQMIASAAQKISRGHTEKLALGDISVQKEWTFAGDIVEAMLKLVSQDVIFEAVIGSGKLYSIQDWLEQCFGVIGKNWQDFVSLKKDFVPEYKKLVSDPQKIMSLGWAPIVSIDQLAEMMVHGSR